MKGLLLCPERVLVMLEMREVPQLEGDMRLYADNVTNIEDMDGNNREDDENKKEVDTSFELIATAARLNMQYCDGRGRHARFQLFGTLLLIGKSSKKISKFMSEVEEGAPKPFLRPIMQCLTNADRTVLDVFPVPYRVDCVHVLSGGHISCGRIGGGVEVGKHLLSGQKSLRVQFEEEGFRDRINFVGKSEHRRDNPNQGNEDGGSDRNNSVVSSRSSVKGNNCGRIWRNLSWCFVQGRATMLAKTMMVPQKGMKRIITTSMTASEVGLKPMQSLRRVTRWHNISRVYSFVSRRGNRVAVGFESGKVGFSYVESGRLLWISVTRQKDELNCIAMSEDGKWVVSGEGFTITGNVAYFL